MQSIVAAITGNGHGHEPIQQNYVFDKPFLVLLKKPEGRRPYFALWVQNSGIMKREPAQVFLVGTLLPCALPVAGGLLACLLFATLYIPSYRPIRRPLRSLSLSIVGLSGFPVLLWHLGLWVMLQKPVGSSRWILWLCGIAVMLLWSLFVLRVLKAFQRENALEAPGMAKCFVSGQRLIKKIAVLMLVLMVVLGAIVLPNLATAIQRSRRSRTIADMRTLATAIGSYMVDNNHFPIQLAEAPLSAAILPESYYTGTYRDGWNYPLFYVSDGETYRLMSYGRDGEPGAETGDEFELDIPNTNGMFGE